jgi:hypothetical protein
MDRYAVLWDDRNERTTSDIVAYFSFESEDQAKRAELLLCEILARTSRAAVDNVIADFQTRVPLILKPIILSLENLKGRVSKEDPIFNKLELPQQGVEKAQGGVDDYVKNIKQQLTNQAWEQVAIAWAEINSFLEEMKNLRTEILGVEIAIARKLEIKSLGRSLTAPFVNPQIGPVVRFESEVRVTFDLLFDGWPAKFCRDIASTVNPNCPFPATATDRELIFKFAGLLQDCGSVKINLLDHEQLPPHQLLNIENHFKEFIVGQGRFCKQMRDANGGIYPKIVNLGDGQSTCEPTIDGRIGLSEFSKLISSQIKELITILRNHDWFQPLIDQLGNRTVALAKVIEPLTKIYNFESEMHKIRKKAIGKKVPEAIADWVLSQFYGSNPPKLPTKNEVYHRFGPNGPQNSSLLGGESRATFGRYLTDIRRLLEEDGFLAPKTKALARKRAPGYNPSDDRQEDINPNSEVER